MSLCLQSDKLQILQKYWMDAIYLLVPKKHNKYTEKLLVSLFSTIFTFHTTGEKWVCG